MACSRTQHTASGEYQTSCPRSQVLHYTTQPLRSLLELMTLNTWINVLYRELEYPEDTRTFGMVSGLWVSMYALGYVQFIIL